MVRTIGWGGMALLALIIAAYAIALVFVPAMRLPFIRERLVTIPIAVVTHLVAAGVALAVGPWQLNSRFRIRFLNLHRWMGRTYVIAVILGGAAGLVLATVSQGGLAAHIGFGLLGVLWVAAAGAAYRRIRAGDQAAHRRWMIRSYSLAFAAVTLRIYVPLSVVAGIPFDAAYQTIAWLCWVPNLVVAEWLILDRAPIAPTRDVDAAVAA